jgi:hypothetical protein
VRDASVLRVARNDAREVFARGELDELLHFIQRRTAFRSEQRPPET